MFGNGNLKRELEDLESTVTSLQAELEELHESHKRDLQVLRIQLAQTASGRPPDPAAILAGYPFTEIPAEEAPDFIANTPDVLILDVRTDAEWSGGHIPDATHMDIREFESHMGELPSDKDRPVICFCAGGARSAAACHMMSEQGYTRLYNVVGGMNRYPGETVQ